MIPLKTIEELIIRHSSIEKDLSTGELDNKLFAEKSKEYSDVNEIIENAKKLHPKKYQYHCRRMKIIEFVKKSMSISLQTYEQKGSGRTFAFQY